MIYCVSPFVTKYATQNISDSRTNHCNKESKLTKKQSKSRNNFNHNSFGHPFSPDKTKIIKYVNNNIVHPLQRQISKNDKKSKTTFKKDDRSPSCKPLMNIKLKNIVFNLNLKKKQL